MAAIVFNGIASLTYNVLSTISHSVWLILEVCNGQATLIGKLKHKFCLVYTPYCDPVLD